ncbi:hypothetical protein [Streptomyces sp. DW26H14]|uniref:hypothetical protein n=1 Tax=Streptomyces sp. DW26H14 TaxID=3435395 RepID=UPI00403E2525
MTGGDVVAQYATGLAETTVTAADGGFLWTRRPGRDVRSDPAYLPGPVPEDFVHRAAAASTGAFTFAVPSTSTGDAHTWKAPGPSSAAHLLMEAADQDPAASAEVAHTYGRHLAAFHVSATATADSTATATATTTANAPSAAAGHPAPSVVTDYPAPRFPTRLATWLRTAAGTRAAPAFHTILRQGLGTRRWETLTTCAREALGPPERPGVVIGWATLGSLIVAVPSGPSVASVPGPRAVLLCGPEGALAAPEIDIGCALGELHEIAASLSARGLPAQRVRAWRDALLAGYTEPLDTARAARTAVVRIAAHAHDFAAYVGFHTELHTYVGMLADLLDHEGAQTMARESP